MVTPPSSHQPNVPGRGVVASYGLRFWLLVVAIGLAAGLAAAGLLELLDAVEHAAWSYRSGSYLTAVQAAPATRHVVVLVVAGAVAGIAMLGLLGLASADRGEVSDAIWLRDGHLPLGSSLAQGVISIVTVGMGASLGREGAPQLAGAAFASAASERLGVPAWQRRLLVACGAGAGMAAVYNVPLGGALFALEVLLGTITLPLVLPAVATTLIATGVAWVAIPNRPTYNVPAYGLSASQIVWAALIGPVAGLAAVAWVRAIARVNARRPGTTLGRVAGPIVIFAGLGGVSVAYPQLLGNGLDIVQSSLVGQLSFGLLAILLVLKPLATVACLGSGAPGGLFTPTLAYGVLIGGLLGDVWMLIWPGGASGSYALIGGAAVLAAAMQGPLAATALMLELTGHADTLIIPMLLAIVEATVVARLLRAPSIYSARLSASIEPPSPPAAAQRVTARARAPVWRSPSSSRRR